MSSTTDRAEIEALFQYDLAPPLGCRGMNRASIAAWLAG
jgi:hypothetical protein